VHPPPLALSRPYPGSIVARRIETEPARDRLDKRRPLAVASTGNRLTHRRVHGEEVVAVALDTGKPVRDRLLGERLGSRLLLDRRRDCPTVVLTQKDDRRFHHTGEVGRFMEIALRRA